jgi:hypothetical protein
MKSLIQICSNEWTSKLQKKPTTNFIAKANSGIHKLDKASKVYKGLATADVEVRNVKKIHS